MRLIDIDDVSLRKTIACGGLSAKALWRRIQQQPTIDAVSVVRCGECKHRQNPYAPKWCYEMSKETDADDFCSYGEREGER